MHSSPGLPPWPNGPVFMEWPEEPPVSTTAASSAAVVPPRLAKPGDNALRSAARYVICPAQAACLAERVLEFRSGRVAGVSAQVHAERSRDIDAGTERVRRC